MSGEDPWDEMVAGLRASDPAAMHAFVRDFGPVLERIAGSAIAPAMRRRFGAESIAQSVCRTFLRRTREGQFELSDPDRVRSLLCAIALTKVKERTRFHLRLRRRASSESPLAGHGGAGPDVADPAPSPDEVVALEDAFAALTASLEPEDRELLERRIAGHGTGEIAELLGCTERTVRRRLAGVEERLRAML